MKTPEIRPRNLQPHLPGLEPSYTEIELQNLAFELDELERFERELSRMFKATKRRSNELQYGTRKTA